jgi:hypothetical protein
MVMHYVLRGVKTEFLTLTSMKIMRKKRGDTRSIVIKNEHMWGCETHFVSKTTICEQARNICCQKWIYVRMREPAGVKKEHVWGYENQLVSIRNICEDARIILCQNRTYVRMRDPVGVKNEHVWGYENQLVSKRDICEDARTSWCQKETYVRMWDPAGVKKERMWGCENQLVSKERFWGCENQLVSKTNVCEEARPSWCQKGTRVRMRNPVRVKKERVCMIFLSLPHRFILT